MLQWRGRRSIKGGKNSVRELYGRSLPLSPSSLPLFFVLFFSSWIFLLRSTIWTHGTGYVFHDPLNLLDTSFLNPPPLPRSKVYEYPRKFDEDIIRKLFTAGGESKRHWGWSCWTIRDMIKHMTQTTKGKRGLKKTTEETLWSAKLLELQAIWRKIWACFLHPRACEGLSRKQWWRGRNYCN